MSKTAIGQTSSGSKSQFKNMSYRTTQIFSADFRVILWLNKEVPYAIRFAVERAWH